MSIYIYSVLYVWTYICGIHTYTQNIKFCSHNQIIYPRRDSIWIQSAHKHNLFSTARVTYNGQPRRYRRGLQSGLPHEFIIEGSKNHRECFMAKPALWYICIIPVLWMFHVMFDLQKCDYILCCSAISIQGQVCCLHELKKNIRFSLV